MYVYTCYMNMKPARGPQTVFCCQRLLWKSMLCKFRWRLRGMYTPPHTNWPKRMHMFFVVDLLLAGLDNVNCYSRPRHLTPSNTER